MTKNFLSILSAFLFIAFSLSSCQKEELSSPGKLTFRGAANADISYSANPACLDEEVTVTFDNGSGSNCGQSHIQVWGPNDATWGPFLPNTLPVNGKVSKPFTPTVAGTYRFRASYQRTGNPTDCPMSNENVSNFEDESLLVEVCGCPHNGNTFTGTSTTDCGDGTHSATYTLCSEDGISSYHVQGGLTNFTGADATVVGPGTSTQHTPGGSSNRIVEIDGSLAACTCATWTLTWNSTNTNGQVTGGWSAVGFGDPLLFPALNCN